MTFTDQNFTRLPFSSIRQLVLSRGPICHLSWAPELGKKKLQKSCRWKWRALKKKRTWASLIYRKAAFLSHIKRSFFFFPAWNFSREYQPAVHKLCHIHPASHSNFGTFTPALFHTPPLCLKSTLYCTLPTFSQQQPSNPNLLLQPLGYCAHFFTEAWANRSTEEFYGTRTDMGSFQRVWNVLNGIWQLWNRHPRFIFCLGTKYGVTVQESVIHRFLFERWDEQRASHIRAKSPWKKHKHNRQTCFSYTIKSRVMCSSVGHILTGSSFLGVLWPQIWWYITANKGVDLWDHCKLWCHIL